MKHMEIVMSVALIAAALATAVEMHAADAQQVPLCLDNGGTISVPAGTTYTDTTGTWTCAPGAAGATAGGWVREAHLPAPTVVPLEPPAPSVQRPPRMSPVYLAIIVAIAFGTALAGIAAYAIRHAPSLHGHVVVVDGQRSTRVDLAAYRGAVTIGTLAGIRIAGEGVLPRHAEFRAEADGNGAIDIIVRPKQGSVSLLRGRNVIHVAIGTPLRDGDQIMLGAARIQYRDLAAGVANLAERRAGP